MATVATPRGRPSNEELLRKPPQEILRWLQKVEAENLKLMFDHGAMMRDVNRRMQVHLMEIRNLREVNERLQRDSQELRDLCCFLDDDRQKGRKLAREWQRFGRYTASVMRQEVSAYQGKLRGLDARQQDLIRDNIQLKELCLYLDQERAQMLCPGCNSIPEGSRDDGDGSSSSTVTNHEEVPSPLPSSPPPRPSPSLPPPPMPPPPPPPPPPVPHGNVHHGSGGHVRPPSVNPHHNGGSRLPSRSHQPTRMPAIEEAIHRHRTIINEQVLRYIRNLEKRIEILESEKGTTKDLHPEDVPHKPQGNVEKKPQSGIPRAPHYRKPDETNHILPPATTLHTTGKGNLESSEPYAGVARPEAVVYAMKVLEVHEQLDKATDSELEFEELAEGEKALVREMCNVVWRKLEDGPAA